MATLYLVRHALAAPPGYMVGRFDFPLSEKGKRQALRLRDDLASVVFSAAWSRPLLRARQTARCILDGNPRNVAEAEIVEGLTEISLGAWEGMSKEAVQREYPEVWQARGNDFVRTAPPGGESMAMLAARVRPAFAALCQVAALHEHSLLVAHQAVNRVILADSMGIPLSRLMHIEQAPAAVTVFEIDGDAVRVVGKSHEIGPSGEALPPHTPPAGG